MANRCRYICYVCVWGMIDSMDVNTICKQNLMSLKPFLYIVVMLVVMRYKSIYVRDVEWIDIDIACIEILKKKSRVAWFTNVRKHIETCSFCLVWFVARAACNTTQTHTPNLSRKKSEHVDMSHVKSNLSYGCTKNP